MSQPAEILCEHRHEAPVPCLARVRLSTDAGITGSGRIRTISVSGAFIETAANLSLDARLTLNILGNHSARDVVERRATVVRLAADGVDVEWRERVRCTICEAVGCGTLCAPAPAIS